MHFGVSEPNSFFTVTYTYIDSLNPRGQASSIKTLEMRAAQSSAENLTNASKLQKSSICAAISAAKFFRGLAKINEGTYRRSSF